MSDAPQTTDTQQIFDGIAEKIIEQQEAIIGPIAVEQAKLIKGMQINWQQHLVDIKNDPQKVIDKLVEQYKELFGQLAVESCKQAADKLLAQLPENQKPATLK